MHHYVVSCVQQNLLKEIHPGLTLFFKCKGIHIIYQ